MKKIRKDFHWAVLLIAILEGFALWYFYSPDIKALFEPALVWGLRIGFWAWCLVGIYLAWKNLLGDIEPILERFRPMEEENEVIIRQAMPDGTVYNGEMGQLYHHLKHFRASEGKGSQAYWKEILRLYPDQKRIKGHALNQLKYYKSKAPTPKLKTA
jgi:hypothetical protein